jgi:ABC-2 type transport system permease protein
MIAALRAEFRKLLTVRSTYFIFGITLAITAFFAGFVEGFKNTPDAYHNPGLLVSESTNAIVFVGFILAFAGLLLVGHEYRYNTIMYSLTSSNRRVKVLLAKLVVVSVFALVSSLVITFFAPLCTIIGASLHGHHLSPQTYDVWSVLWRCLFCGWGYAVYAFILAVILRNQIGAIVTFLVVPMIGENILALLLKDNAKDLPFNAVQSVAAPMQLGNHADPGHQALIVLMYVAVGLIVGAVAFTRRDAN